MRLPWDRPQDKRIWNTDISNYTRTHLEVF